MSIALLDPVETTLEPSTRIETHAGASFFCHRLKMLAGGDLVAPRILVAGCGAGHEAVAIQQSLGGQVDAIDVENFVSEKLQKHPSVHFQIGSVCELPFESNTFDAIFYHHVIEHVDRPQASLTDLARVLKPEGWLFVGTPNRHRLASSVGAHQQSEWEATFSNKVADNLRDWKDRLTGRFRNELGAHAGFSQSELDAMLAKEFDRRIWLTADYLKYKYSAGRMASLVSVATHPALLWFAAPSIYAFCTRLK